MWAITCPLLHSKWQAGLQTHSYLALGTESLPSLPYFLAPFHSWEHFPGSAKRYCVWESPPPPLYKAVACLSQGRHLSGCAGHISMALGPCAYHPLQPMVCIHIASTGPCWVRYVGNACQHSGEEDFSGGSTVRTLWFHCRWHRFDPQSGKFCIPCRAAETKQEHGSEGYTQQTVLE